VKASNTGNAPSFPARWLCVRWTIPEEARRTADKMLALGKDLVERHSDQPMAHLVLSEAYFQLSKNAWRIEDRATVRLTLRRSLDSALRARSLDPESKDARHLAGILQRRLDDLAVGELNHPISASGTPIADRRP
jgi:hypothetical protein